MEPVEFFVSKKKYYKHEHVVCNAVQRTLQILKKKGTVELHMVTNEEMKRINKDTRNVNKSTNVLSFESLGFMRADKTHYLGEIYLAPDFIQKKKQDIELLAVHGVLHLLGYTHEKKRDRIVMEKVEDRILSSLKNS